MKKQKLCPVVVDLLPNYMENLTGEETRKWIDCHLGQCKYCQSHYERIEEEILCRQLEQRKEEKKIKQAFSRYRYQMFGMVVGIILGTVIIIAGITAWGYIATRMVQENVIQVETPGGEIDE